MNQKCNIITISGPSGSGKTDLIENWTEGLKMNGYSTKREVIDSGELRAAIRKLKEGKWHSDARFYFFEVNDPVCNTITFDEPSMGPKDLFHGLIGCANPKEYGKEE